MSEKKIVFSGIQPTGALHLGNYLGAIQNWVQLQNTHQSVFCLVDLHAITVSHNPEQLKKQILESAAQLLACGVDPKKSLLFVQSQNRNHAQLAWILNCVARIGWLNRMTQFKDKTGKKRDHAEKASVGLYDYPVLMAADILLYRTTHVPVGEDQKQHLELAAAIAQKFNNDYGEVFAIPKEIIPTRTARIMSLRDGKVKMSKSDPSEMSRILLTDSDETIDRKISRAKTDSDPLPSAPQALEARPEIQNLVSIAAAIEEISPDHVLEEWSGRHFEPFKKWLAERLCARIAPLRERIRQYTSKPAQLEEILQDSAIQAQTLSEPVLQSACKAMGVRC